MESNKRQELLALFHDLRVADVRDGMDWMMLHTQGSMGVDIRPLWRTRAVGIACTARYLPYQGTIPAMTPAEYTQWQGWYYGNVCTYPWVEEIQPGDFVILDLNGVNVGLLGSNNTLDCVRRGVSGFVSSDGVRDTDEIILQRIPFWSKYCSQGMVQGRLQYADRNIPVEVGGVLVYPGDVVVADGDGVIVVPQKLAFDVAREAQHEFTNDKADRRKKYIALGMELDDTVW